MSSEFKCKRARIQVGPEECTSSNSTLSCPLNSTRKTIHCFLTEQNSQNVENLPNQLAQLTLKQYFELNREKIEESIFKSILRDLINAIELKHSQKLVVKNISLDDIKVQTENNTFRRTLSEVNKIETEDDYLKDIINVGLLIVSILDASCDNEKLFQEINQIKSYDHKVNHVTTKLTNAQIIQLECPKSLADLVVKCLHVEHQNYKIIKNFKDHAYFVGEINTHSNTGCSSKENNLVTERCTKSPSKVTLRKFIDNHKAEIDENVFKKIVKILLNELEIKHLHKIILNNITLDTVTITIDDNEPIPTLLNVPKTRETATKEDYVKDIMDVGILILSIFIVAEELDGVIRAITELPDYEHKFEFACLKLKNLKWIQQINQQLFIDFVVCIINVKSSNNPRAKEFKRHPYFWDEDKISRFIDKINSRLNLSADGGTKDQNRKILVNIRKELLEAQMPKNYDWQGKLGTKIQAFYPTDNTWSELIKFIRNRDTHSEDCTDSESEYKENDVPIVSTTNSKACKDPEALKQLSKFLSSKNGALSYFLSKLDNLLYLLFNHFRLYADHPVMKKFYCKSFLFENPKDAFDKVVAKLTPKKLAEKGEPKKPGFQPPSHTSTKRPPDTSSNKRNDLHRSTSDRARKIADAIGTPIGCFRRNF